MSIDKVRSGISFAGSIVTMSSVMLAVLFDRIDQWLGIFSEPVLEFNEASLFIAVPVLLASLFIFAGAIELFRKSSGDSFWDKRFLIGFMLLMIATLIFFWALRCFFVPEKIISIVRPYPRQETSEMIQLVGTYKNIDEEAKLWVLRTETEHEDLQFFDSVTGRNTVGTFDAEFHVGDKNSAGISYALRVVAVSEEVHRKLQDLKALADNPQDPTREPLRIKRFIPDFDVLAQSGKVQILRK